MKKIRIIYWISTGLLSAAFLMSGILYLSGDAGLLKNFREIGFPGFFVQILGVAKLLGAFALINPWFPLIREWAYAGFTFVLTGAVWVHLATGTPFAAPLVFLLLLGTSYMLYKRLSTGASRPAVA